MVSNKVTGINCVPVAIGGVGGSGTRLIAQILKDLGFYIGSDLNEANDNLWFTLLFKRIEILSETDGEFDELVQIFLNGMIENKEFTKSQIKLINNLSTKDRPQHNADWLGQRVNTLLSRQNSSKQSGAWGWKEPNTHIVLDRLHKALPDIKYIHVARNGLDMAHSTNQNQLKLWGTRFIGEDCEISPYYSLKYWCIVHERVLDIGKLMGSRFLFFNYDQFCLEPRNSLTMLLEFLEVDISETRISSLLQLVRVPASMGRFKQHGLEIFAPEDVLFVQRQGFATNID